MDDERLLRYGRHILLPEIDIAGQERLLDSHVLLVGAGGLGSPAAMYLATAGIGRLTLVDADRVELTNLQRQILHSTNRLGMNKAESGSRTLGELNPDCAVTPVAARVDADNLPPLLETADLVLDCSDNFATRFAVNAACHAARKPLVSGAAIRWDGQVAVFSQRPGTACYRCLYPADGEDGERCAETGVFGPLVGMVGSVQAAEAIKCLLGCGETLENRLLAVDGLRMRWRELALRPDPACPVCGGTP